MIPIFVGEFNAAVNPFAWACCRDNPKPLSKKAQQITGNGPAGVMEMKATV